MRKILVVVDMQNDFITGTLGTGEAAGIVGKVRDKIASFPAENVFATMDTHGADYSETEEGKNLPVVHCIRGTWGWEIHPDIAGLIAQGNIYEKHAFGSLQLAEALKAIADKEEIEIELVGLCTDICVVSNALLFKAVMPGIKIFVDPSCCAGVTPQKHLAALDTMRSCQIHVVEETKDPSDREAQTIRLASELMDLAATACGMALTEYLAVTDFFRTSAQGHAVLEKILDEIDRLSGHYDAIQEKLRAGN